jgi:hypothetical protein
MISQELPGFETLRELAEHDPERLERLRHDLTEQLIANAPPRSQQRLRGLQFQIETRLRLAPNPIAACIAVSGMMHETLDHLRHALTDWPRPPPALPGAQVLRFPKDGARRPSPPAPLP